MSTYLGNIHFHISTFVTEASIYLKRCSQKKSYITKNANIRSKILVRANQAFFPFFCLFYKNVSLILGSFEKKMSFFFRFQFSGQNWQRLISVWWLESFGMRRFLIFFGKKLTIHLFVTVQLAGLRTFGKRFLQRKNFSGIRNANWKAIKTFTFLPNFFRTCVHRNIRHFVSLPVSLWTKAWIVC